MTTVAILADPPREDVVLPKISSSILSSDEATTLYTAMLADVTVAVHAAGGETILNYRDDDQLPESDGKDPETQLSELVTETLESLDDVRFEVQVGSEYYARVGNTVTHLLEREGTNTAAVVEPTAPFLTRSVVDNGAMKLRSSDVVLGPTTDGRVYFAGFGESIDFTDVFETPAVETLTRRAREEGLSVDFLPMQPVVETTEDLLTAIPALRSRRAAERIHPGHTSLAIEELDLHIATGDDGAALVRR